MHATRDIEPGEDINITISADECHTEMCSYRFTKNPYPQRGGSLLEFDSPLLEEFRSKAKGNESIFINMLDGSICSTQHCICRDKNRDALIQSDTHAYDALLIWDTKKPYTKIRAAEDWETISRLVENLEKLRLSPTIKAHLLRVGFRIAMRMKEKNMLDIAQEYIKQAYEILSGIFHPDSAHPKQIRSLLLGAEVEQQAKSSVGNELESEAEQMRRCGYCVKRIPPQNITLCGKCHRRAYCSVKCQKYDWTSKRGLETC